MISRIQALNYRCLRYVDQALGDFHVLVGANATGKSSFLDVVAMLGDLLEFGLEEALLATDNGGRGRGRASRWEELVFHQAADRFELAVEMSLPQALQRVPGNGGRRYARYEVSIGGASGSSELAVLNETLWLCSGDAPRPAHKGTQLDVFPSEPVPLETVFRAPGRRHSPPGWRKLISKTERGTNFLSETTDWNNVFRTGPRRLALASLPDDEEKFPVGSWVRDSLMQRIHVLALNSQAMRRPASPSLPRSFRPDGSNLPLVVRDLRDRHESVFRAWLAHVQTVLSDIVDINTHERPEDRHVYLQVTYRDGGPPVPSWLLSDGTLRFLALTLLAYLPEHHGMYLIEEPENGIHPRAIEAVFASLSSVYGGQVLLATHSPLIVGLAAEHREQVLCFARTAQGATDIVSGLDHPRLKQWKGEVDLSTLYAMGVLS